MADNKVMRNDNIKKINEILTSKTALDVLQKLSTLESNVKNLKKKIDDKLDLFAKQKAQEQAKVVESVPEEAKVEEKPIVKEVPKAIEPEVVTIEQVEEVKETSVVPQPKQVDETPVQPAPEKPQPKKNEFIVSRGVFIRTDDKKKPNEFRPKREQGEFKPKKPMGDKPFAPRQGDNKQERFAGKKPQNTSTYVAPPVIMKEDKRSFGKKKQTEKNYDEQKHVVNKRSLIRNNVSIDDFDENKTGYRKLRPAKKAKDQQEVNVIKIEKAVINTEIIALKSLSEKIGITAADRKSVV